VRYTPEQKAQRKHTIAVRNKLDILDAYAPPTSPPKIIHHPRFFDAPLSCQSGKHQWFNKTLMGIPIMKCRKCGRIVMKGSYEGTETKHEIRTRNIPKPYKEKNLKELVEEYYRGENRDAER